MAYPCTYTLPAPPSEVFGAALTVASQVGFTVSRADQQGGHLYLDQRRRLSQYPRRHAVSITDNGLGSTVVQITWQPRSRLPWRLRPGERNGARLHRLIRRILGG